jgi:DNA polymerase I
MSLFGGIKLTGKPDLNNIRKLDLLPMNSIMEMMKFGIAIDLDHLHIVGDKLSSEMIELKKEIVSYIPEDKLDIFMAKSNLPDDDDSPMNIDSNQQLCELLFRELKIGVGRELKYTKSGKQLSVGKKQLEILKREHPVIQKILNYKEHAKLKNTYVDSLPGLAKLHKGGRCWCGLAHEEDHYRIHTTILTTRTTTGRLASKNPNLQNVSTRTELGRLIRAAFVSSMGRKLVSCDWSQIEMRIMAHYSKDDNLIRIFRNNLDPHTDTAKRAFKVDDPDKLTQRNPCKNVNFGVCIKGGQRVLTNRGLVKIEEIKYCDLLWDGIEWVSHNGVIYKGIQEVITYEGITATPGHKVWLQNGSTTTIAEAMDKGFKLAISGNGTSPIGFETDYRYKNRKRSKWISGNINKMYS